MADAAPWGRMARLDEAVPIIEANARRHGWPGSRVRTWPEASIEAARARLGPIPEPLIELSRWYDDDCWSYCINPAQRGQSGSTSVRADGWRSRRGDPDEWRDEVFRFLHPNHWDRRRDGLFEFAWTMFGDEVMRTTDGLVTGSDHDNPDHARFIHARSLPEWMARIACCTGIDLCILGAESDRIPAEHRRAAIVDFMELNPGYPWLR